MASFTDIKTQDVLFKLLNIPKKNMTYLLYNKEEKGPENAYHTFSILKKNGDKREIDAPNDELKFVQKRLAILLWANQKKSWRLNNTKPNISHGFEESKSIITNAKIHRNKKIVLNLDLEDFFPSIHFGRVKGFFEKNKNFKVPKEVALVIARLVCYKGRLPQGAPTSPIISNLICRILDFRLLKLAKKYRLDYTRYADDLTFSTNSSSFVDEEQFFLDKLEKEIIRAGFKINAKKTRLQFSNSRQEVTGLTVNKKLNVSKEFYKNTRAMAHKLYTTGEFLIDGESGTINQLEGRFAFINQLDKYNNGLEYEISLNKNNIEYQKFLLSTIKVENNHQIMLLNLNSREKEYQKFLYYKYFYGNEIPTIVTEGKTDIRYLKAALKKMYKDYPILIEKNGNDYKFKVHFLKRVNKKGNKDISRLKYFFNLPIDGADAMKNLYNFFSDKNNKLYPNYLEYFNFLSTSKPSNPTFFIFDNELNNDKKPLRGFINYINEKKNMQSLKDNGSLRVTENLYVLTNQLIGEAEENEIEDLFDKKTLEHKIGGKSFSKKSISEKNNFYGKEIFSKYVLDNFENIDFENFRPMLNNLSRIISDYGK